MCDYIENMFRTRHFSVDNLISLRDLIEDPILGRRLRNSELERHGGVPNADFPINRIHAVVDGLCVDHDGKIFKVMRYMGAKHHVNGCRLVRVAACAIRDGDGEVRVFTACVPGGIFAGYEQVAPGIIEMKQGRAGSVKLGHGLYVVRANRWQLPGSWLWKIKTTIKRQFYHPLTRCCWDELARERQYTLELREDEINLVVDVGLVDVFYSERLHTHKNPGDDLHVRMLMSCASRRRELTTPEWVIQTTILYFLSICERCAVEPVVFNEVVHTDARTLASIFKSKDFRVVPLSPRVEFLTEDVDLEVPLVFNGNVELISSQGVTFSAENGLRFDTPYTQPTPLYIYGPVLLNGSVKYTKRSTNNAEAAFTRMINSRENEIHYRDAQDLTLMVILDMHEPHVPIALRQCARQFGAFGVGGWSGVNHQNVVRAFAAQTATCQAHILHVVVAWLRFVDGLLQPFPDPVKDMDHVMHLQRILHQPILELNRAYAEQPHPKLAERLLAMANIEDNLSLFYDALKKVDAKVKYETAKVGKVPRQYITLGAEAALRFPDIPAFMKNAMSKECSIGDRGIITFVPSPTVEAMDKWADITMALHNYGPLGFTFTGFYHSDDTHFSMRCEVGGEEHTISCGLDIKKCDLSHGPGIFLVAALLAESVTGLPMNAIYPLFEQLKSNIRVRHPDPKSTDYALFRAQQMMLFSGSVLTTYVNNVASALILCSIYTRFVHADFPSHEAIKEAIIDAALVVGYDVSIDSYTSSLVGEGADNLPNETFLKHFPCMVHGRARGLKCLAPLLRNYGVSDEPVPEWEDRENSILLGLTSSYMPECFQSVFEQRRLRLPPEVQMLWTPMDCYAQRYGVTPVELSSSLVEFLTLRSPCAVREPALSKVLEVGYGLLDLG